MRLSVLFRETCHFHVSRENTITRRLSSHSILVALLCPWILEWSESCYALTYRQSLSSSLFLWDRHSSSLFKENGREGAKPECWLNANGGRRSFYNVVCGRCFKGMKGRRDNSKLLGLDDRLVSDLPMEQRGIGVGIDLGTTNSAVAILTADEKSLYDSSQGLYTALPTILDINGDRTIPSVVSLLGLTVDDAPNERWLLSHEEREKDRSKHILVGKEAIKVEVSYPSCTYRHVKRILGTGGEQARMQACLVPNLTVGGSAIYDSASTKISFKKRNSSIKKLNPSTSKSVSVPLSQQLEEADTHPALLSWCANASHQETRREDASTIKSINPELVSACVLRHLFDVAEEHAQRHANSMHANINTKVTRAVVGVPAYFNDAQRDATIRACAMAGVTKIRLLKEPEAAALAYGLGKDHLSSTEKDFEDELVLVFDLGGGTFDVSVLAVGGGIMEVVATSGNAVLGGSDFDNRIMEWIIDQSGVTRAKNTAAQDAILRSAEAIRIYLSNNKRASLSLPSTMEGWLSIDDPKTVIIASKEKSSNDSIAESNQMFIEVELTRRQMEKLCLEEFQELLKPIREVAILAGALLPGDSRPQVAAAALQMEEEFQQQQRARSIDFEDFFLSEDRDDPEYSLQESTLSSASPLLDIRDTSKTNGAVDIRALRKQQQSSRRRARDIATQEKKFRGEAQKAKTRAKKNQTKTSTVSDGATKVKESISGRPLSQVVLVGGATRMPAIGRMLTVLTGVTPKRTVNPDEAVALGAAIQVGILDGDERLSDLQVLSPMKAAMMRAIAQKQQKEQDKK